MMQRLRTNKNVMIEFMPINNKTLSKIDKLLKKIKIT